MLYFKVHFLDTSVFTVWISSNYTVCPGGKRRQLAWSEAMQQSFQAIKDSLCQATQLAHPSPEAEISLAVDALDWCVGAVLQQRDGGNWRPLAFYSKKLDLAQHKYSAFDRELLAVYLAIRHFRF
jgi:RNase H-like domain found in reverse transcriptase